MWMWTVLLMFNVSTDAPKVPTWLRSGSISLTLDKLSTQSVVVSDVVCHGSCYLRCITDTWWEELISLLKETENCGQVFQQLPNIEPSIHLSLHYRLPLQRVPLDNLYAPICFSERSCQSLIRNSAIFFQNYIFFGHTSCLHIAFQLCLFHKHSKYGFKDDLVVEMFTEKSTTSLSCWKQPFFSKLLES